MTLSFFVPGIPQTAGSKRAFPLKKNGVFTGRNIVVDANPKAKDWKSRVASFAEPLMLDKPLMEGPLRAHFVFHMPRIGSHYRANGSLKPNAPIRPVTRPDVLKLSRAVEDALTGIVYRDDSQIASEILDKIYADKPGVFVMVYNITDDTINIGDASHERAEPTAQPALL